MCYTSPMPLHYRRRINLGPVRLNFTERGLTSLSLKLGPLTYSLKTKKTTVNLPGTGSIWTSK